MAAHVDRYRLMGHNANGASPVQVPITRREMLSLTAAAAVAALAPSPARAADASDMYVDGETVEGVVTAARSAVEDAESTIAAARSGQSLGYVTLKEVKQSIADAHEALAEASEAVDAKREALSESAARGYKGTDPITAIVNGIAMHVESLVGSIDSMAGTIASQDAAIEELTERCEQADADLATLTGQRASRWDATALPLEVDGYVKVMDGHAIPWSVDKASYDDATQPRVDGTPDEERGIGIIMTDDGVWQTSPGPVWRRSTTNGAEEAQWAITARWEYVTYSMRDGKWKNNRSGIDTGMSGGTRDGGDGDMGWYGDARVLLVDRETGKAAICAINDWGGNPCGILAGLNNSSDGGESEVQAYFGGASRCSTTGFVGEMYWAPRGSAVGPVEI